MRILILSASVGAGHLRAAQAVELAAREKFPDAEVKNVDVLTLTNGAFRKLYGEAYLDLVNKAPHVLGYVYDYLDRPRKVDSKREGLRRAVQKLNLRELCSTLECEAWDVLICTHFLPAEIIAELKRKRKIKAPLITVTTDFDTHRLWVNEPCDAYTTATEEGRLYLGHWGVDLAKVTVTGIPIHPVFAKEKTRAACVKALGLEGTKPMVLQSAGGFGVGPIEELYRGLLSVKTPLEVIVVCGKNEKVKKQLASVDVPARHTARVLGFTDKMDELMTCAEIVLTKPGGLTTSEVLARGVVMAIVNPIPGQETRNADYLLENGAAVKVSSTAVVAHKIETLLTDKARLARLRKASKALGKPRAAYDVVDLAVKLAGGPR